MAQPVNWAQRLENMQPYELKRAYKEVRDDPFFPRLAAKLLSLLRQKKLRPDDED